MKMRLGSLCKENSLSNFSLPTQASWLLLRSDSSKVHSLIKPAIITLEGFRKFFALKNCKTKMLVMSHYLPKRITKKCLNFPLKSP